MTLIQFRKFVDKVMWKFAKTYAEFSPHEYYMGVWKMVPKQEWDDARQFVIDHAVPEGYCGKLWPCFYDRGYKYWAGPLGEEFTGIINRASREMCVRFEIPWMSEDEHRSPGHAKHGNTMEGPKERIQMVVPRRKRMEGKSLGAIFVEEMKQSEKGQTQGGYEQMEFDL